MIIVEEEMNKKKINMHKKILEPRIQIIKTR